MPKDTSGTKHISSLSGLLATFKLLSLAICLISSLLSKSDNGNKI